MDKNCRYPTLQYGSPPFSWWTVSKDSTIPLLVSTLFVDRESMRLGGSLLGASMAGGKQWSVAFFLTPSNHRAQTNRVVVKPRVSVDLGIPGRNEFLGLLDAKPVSQPVARPLGAYESSIESEALALPFFRQSVCLPSIGSAQLAFWLPLQGQWWKTKKFHSENANVWQLGYFFLI